MASGYFLITLGSSISFLRVGKKASNWERFRIRLLICHFQSFQHPFCFRCPYSGAAEPSSASARQETVLDGGSSDCSTFSVRSQTLNIFCISLKNHKPDLGPGEHLRFREPASAPCAGPAGAIFYTAFILAVIHNYYDPFIHLRLIIQYKFFGFLFFLFLAAEIIKWNRPRPALAENLPVKPGPLQPDKARRRLSPSCLCSQQNGLKPAKGQLLYSGVLPLLPTYFSVRLIIHTIA